MHTVEVMTKPVRHNIITTDETKFHTDDADKCIDLLNNIYWFTLANGWLEGYRNSMALDWCIACEMLDLDPVGEAKSMLNVDVDGYADMMERIEKIHEYGYGTDDCPPWYRGNQLDACSQVDWDALITRNMMTDPIPYELRLV